MAETEIREAVAGEMEELLRDMEGSYKVTFPIPRCFISPMRKATIPFVNISKTIFGTIESVRVTICVGSSLIWQLHIVGATCTRDR